MDLESGIAKGIVLRRQDLFKSIVTSPSTTKKEKCCNFAVLLAACNGTYPIQKGKFDVAGSVQLSCVCFLMHVVITFYNFVLTISYIRFSFYNFVAASICIGTSI